MFDYYRDLLPKSIYTLYKDTYWSNHQYSNKFSLEHLEQLNEMVKNREIIAERYGLKKRITKFPQKYNIHVSINPPNRKYNDYHEYYRDHIEYYKDNDNHIISIFSMYCNNEDLINLIQQNGYQIIEPIYNKDQKTFIKKIRTK